MEKNFLISCRCGWRELSTGIAQDLTHLKEVKLCAKCGRARTFRCPHCGKLAKMIRIKGNR